MHVHELNPKKTLIVLVAFMLLLVVGFITMKKPLINYQLDMNQSLEMLHDADAYFHPGQLAEMIGSKDKNVVLIDLRNNFEYSRGAIPGAENISTVDLTRKENIERLQELQKQDVTVVFYAEDQLQANGPWMLFRQLGFDNVKILMGGYAFYQKWQHDVSGLQKDDSYITGIQRHDFSKAAVNTMAIEEDRKSDKPAIQITRRKKPVVASGGC